MDQDSMRPMGEFPRYMILSSLQCSDTGGWATGRAVNL